MKWLLFSAVLVLFISCIVCPPVKVKKEEKKQEPEVEPAEDVNFGLEYERYLKEVVSILETDDEFKKKLEESNISDIKSGDIARHLELVSHNIRTKLDELKRQELDRLRQIQRINMRRKQAVKNPTKKAWKKGVPLRDIPDANRLVAHLDHSNPHTFEVDDLSKLIKQATEDLEGLDKQRKKDFKEYELEKELLHKKKMDGLDEEHRKEEEKKWDEQKKKHGEHPKLHHPGSKDQLEEVWEESDGLNKDDFDPRTFFMLHDTNGDGVLDPVEVEALFQKELDKIYDPNAPEDDMMERYEEMNRMREHVMKEVDKNRDSYITMKEFLDSTKTDEFEKDDGWKGLDEQELFTDEELAQFEREYEERRRQNYEYEHAQPGEIQLGVPSPSYIPPVEGGDQPPHIQQPAQGQGGVHPAMMHRPKQYQPQPPHQQQQQYQQQQYQQQPQYQQPQYQQQQPHYQQQQPQQQQQFQQPNQNLQFQPQYQQQQVYQAPPQQLQQPQAGGQQFVHPHAAMRQHHQQQQQQQPQVQQMQQQQMPKMQQPPVVQQQQVQQQQGQVYTGQKQPNVVNNPVDQQQQQPLQTKSAGEQQQQQQPQQAQAQAPIVAGTADAQNKKIEIKQDLPGAGHKEHHA